MKKELLEYSYKNNLSHIPSALSMLDYVDELFTKKLVTPDDYIILGKPFGAQAYYLVWRKLGYLSDIEKLGAGVKHDEIEFVDYSEETMGNALGVSAGIAMTTEKLVWVNLSDAALQMGNTLEAIQFIGHHKLKNILVTVDFNNSQVLGNISDILPVEPVINFFHENGWQVNTGIEDFNIGELPKVFIMKTKKGNGVPSIEKDIKKWHYKRIETLEELQSLVAELPDI
jgi:transketolase N-terminal domain/subunit